ncbi:hypothetical protein NBRC116494_25260 [Aurantivibrio plasticivorans]
MEDASILSRGTQIWLGVCSVVEAPLGAVGSDFGSLSAKYYDICGVSGLAESSSVNDRVVKELSRPNSGFTVMVYQYGIVYLVFILVVLISTFSKRYISLAALPVFALFTSFSIASPLVWLSYRIVREFKYRGV